MPSWCGVALDGADEVLHHERHAAERAVGRLGACARALSNSGWITALSSRVQRLDALDRALDELARLASPRADEVGLGGGV